MSQLVHQPIEETERSLRILQAEVRQIARSGLVPEALKKTTRDGVQVDEAALIHIGLTAHALGVSNLSTALQHIHAIKGRICISADLAVGVAEHRGILRWRCIETSASKCVVEGFRTDWPEAWKASPTRIEFTIEDAKRAGLLEKNGAVWKSFPQQMLQARAKKQLARLLAADVLTGLRDANGGQMGMIADVEDDPVVVTVDDTVRNFDVIDAEIVEDDPTIDTWPAEWSDAVRAAGFGADESAALIRFASEGKVTRSVDLEDADRPIAEQTLDHIVEGRWHLADGRVVEAVSA